MSLATEPYNGTMASATAIRLATDPVYYSEQVAYVNSFGGGHWVGGDPLNPDTWTDPNYPPYYVQDTSGQTSIVHEPGFYNPDGTVDYDAAAAYMQSGPSVESVTFAGQTVLAPAPGQSVTIRADGSVVSQTIDQAVSSGNLVLRNDAERVAMGLAPLGAGGLGNGEILDIAGFKVTSKNAVLVLLAILAGFWILKTALRRK